MNITAVIISKNAELTIAKTLESLKVFSEVVVLDTGSTDKTIEIASLFANVKIYKHEFEGFGKSKNRAVSLAKHDWVFSVDTDEVLDNELIKSIFKLKPENGFVYRIKRCNYYHKRKINFSGWGSEYLVRLFNRKTTQFKEKLVHESVDDHNHQIADIQGELKHYSYQTIADFTKKREFYSDLFAIENRGKRKSSGTKALTHGFYEFFSTFILKLGFLDGYIGLLIAGSNAYVTFLKYIKLYEANLNEQNETEALVQPLGVKRSHTEKPVFDLSSIKYANDLKSNVSSIATYRNKALQFTHNKN